MKEIKEMKEMNIEQEAIEVHRKFSKVGAEFMDWVEENPEAFEASSFKSLALNDDLFVLQPWPTFVNKATVDLFREAGVALFEIIKDIPGRIFGNDPKKLSAYYKIPQHLVELQLEGITAEHLQNLLGRGDFLWTASGLKCLEYNVTANLGGWSVPIWETMYLKNPIISKFLNGCTVKITNKNLIRQLMEHIVHCTIGHCTKDKLADAEDEMNILFVAGDTNRFVDTMKVYLSTLLKGILKQENLPFKGDVFICDYQYLDIVDDFVYYRGKKIQALVEMYNGVVSPRVMEVFKAGKIRLFNGPITYLLSSKLNLALLSDYKATHGHLFSEEEKQVIDKYVPWSRKIVHGDTRYGTETVRLENFILAHKDKMVLKPSLGYGGKGVHIGRNTPAPEWGQLIETALGQGDWLVQEFVETLPALYQFGEKGAQPHDMAWGFFVLGSRYAGAWVRVLPTGDNKGVINCHQGARVSVILEVDE